MDRANESGEISEKTAKNCSESSGDTIYDSASDESKTLVSSEEEVVKPPKKRRKVRKNLLIGKLKRGPLLTIFKKKTFKIVIEYLKGLRDNGLFYLVLGASTHHR